MNAVYTDDPEQVHGCAGCLDGSSPRTCRTEDDPGWGGLAPSRPEGLSVLRGEALVKMGIRRRRN